MKYHKINRKRGAAIMTAVIFFVVIATTIAVGLSSPVVREYTTARDFEKSKGAYYLSEAGQEDALYRIKTGKTIGAQEVIFLGGNTATTTITTVSANQKTISSLGDILRNTRRVKSTLTTTPGESFMYGVQAGNGGIRLENTSSITGSVFTSGNVKGSGNVITGTVISGGSTGLNGEIDGIQNQGGSSMHADRIENSTISGSAYCNNISGSSTSTCNTLTAQLAPPFSITDQDITDYETAAAAGGTYSTPCTISSNTTWSARKMTCSTLYITGGTLTLTGNVWVTGNVEISNSAKVKVDTSLGAQSAGIIAHNTANRTTSSKITISNSSTFNGSGTAGSYVLLLSQNNSSELGGATEAIRLQNSASGDILLYASHGEVTISNTTSLKEVAAYKLHLTNSANVAYSTGLQNVFFTSGPGGAWAVQDWMEGQ